MSTALLAVDLNQVLDWAPVVATVALVATIGMYAVIGVKCTSCGTRKTLTPTGETRPARTLGVKHEELWRCGSCAATTWVLRLRWWMWIP
jgi:hypothetical protein